MLIGMVVPVILVFLNSLRKNEKLKLQGEKIGEICSFFLNSKFGKKFENSIELGVISWIQGWITGVRKNNRKEQEQARIATGHISNAIQRIKNIN